MNFSDYQEHARETAIYPGRKSSINGLLYTTIGLGGEAGELLNKVKKILRDSNGNVSPNVIVELIGELGDILWYVAMTCDELDVQMDGVAQSNLFKLRKRKQDGKIGGSGDNR